MTHDLVVKIKSLTSLVPVPHLTYVCHQAHEFEEIFQRHIAASVGAILALSEVSPHDQQHGDRSKDTFRYAADLVCFIRPFNAARGHSDPRGFGVGVLRLGRCGIRRRARF